MGMSGGGFTASSARRRGRAPMSEINVTPLVDVMLVLLIVFMVTAPLLTAGIKLDLPKAGGAPLADQQKPVIVSVDAEGGVHLGPDTVSLTDLVARLAAETPDRDARIYLRGDTTTDYGHIAEVMGALAAAGYGRVALVTIAREPN